MKATLKVELKPFQVPNFVLAAEKTSSREDGFNKGVSYPLSDLDPYTLDALCNQFRNEVFKKAGKRQPPQDTGEPINEN